MTAAAIVVAIVHPEFDLLDVESGYLFHCRYGLFGRGDFEYGMERRGALDEEGIGAASGRGDAGGEEETGGGRELAGELIALEGEGEIDRLIAHGHSRADAVERFALQVIEDVGAGVVFDA